MRMTSTYRPRRSVLYMPAANERALEKGKEIEADALIFDLEDAVAPGAKNSLEIKHAQLHPPPSTEKQG